MDQDISYLSKYMQQMQEHDRTFYLFLLDESIKKKFHSDPSFHPSVIAYNICRKVQKIPFSYPEYVRVSPVPQKLNRKKLKEISLGIKAYRNTNDNERENFKKALKSHKKESKILAFFSRMRLNKKR